MDFIKYQHVEKFGTDETEGIDIGTCFIFPKIDGTNGQLWWDGELKAGSRNRELTLGYDNQGFYKWALGQTNIFNFFHENPDLRLYGEWLVPHTLKTYRDDAWRKFYVFDVSELEDYLNYETYQPLLEKYRIEYIPPICKVKNPTYERLVHQLENNVYLIKDGEGTGEGIVIKNYDYRNKYGRVTWAKIVKNEFKAKHAKVQTTEIKEKQMVEQQIVDKFVTKTLVDKEYAKIVNEAGWNSKMIPRLLNTVFYCLITEESWNFIKEHKNPTINFKTLQSLTIVKIKEVMPEIF